MIWLLKLFAIFKKNLFRFSQVEAMRAPKVPSGENTGIAAQKNYRAHRQTLDVNMKEHYFNQKYYEDKQSQISK